MNKEVGKHIYFGKNKGVIDISFPQLQARYVSV